LKGRRRCRRRIAVKRIFNHKMNVLSDAIHLTSQVGGRLSFRSGPSHRRVWPRSTEPFTTQPRPRHLQALN